MPSPVTIKCADCGSEYRTTRKNAKYCAFHRFLRDIQFARRNGRVKSCTLCSTKFMATEDRQQMCGIHNYSPAGLKGAPVQCHFCSRLRPKVHPDVAVCAECATDPQHNRAFLDVLHHKDQWLQRNPYVIKDHDDEA